VAATVAVAHLQHLTMVEAWSSEMHARAHTMANVTDVETVGGHGHKASNGALLEPIADAKIIY